MIDYINISKFEEWRDAGNLWIGVERFTNGEWRFTDELHTPISLNDWDAGQPSAYGVGLGENCAGSRKNYDLLFKWHDYPCSDTFKYVCERLFKAD